MVCAVESCDRPRRGRQQWCDPHYRRFLRYGNPEEPPKKGRRFCEIEDCGKPAHGHGMCLTHYRRSVRNGSPTYRMRGQVIDGKKICTCCGEDKSLDQYGVNRALRDGLMVYCKPCAAEKARLMREKTGRDVVNERARVYRSSNPYYWRSGNAERRARIYGQEHETIKPQDVFARDGWMCGICSGPIDRDLRYPDPMSASVDHVIPLVRGGLHVLANCQASHLVCNMRKHAVMEPGLDVRLVPVAAPQAD